MYYGKIFVINAKMGKTKKFTPTKISMFTVACVIVLFNTY